ncbi:MAG TPA: hypothetical protein VFV87_17200 [Pirellulaceae bacterium]|nr:hypothetical protein [Pirellulaceae bacterium]
MTTTQHCLSKIALGWTGAALIALAGCDITGEYEKRFQETLTTAGHRAAFDAVLFAAETEITGEANASSGVKLRLPSLFDNSSKSLATEPRAQPPFVKLPGFGYALERALPDDANQFAPAYIYFAAVPKADLKPDQAQAPIAVAVAAAFPGATWSDVQVSTPQGGSITHKVIRGDGPQDFDNAGTGGAVQKLDGRFALYFIEGPNHYALVGFRAPKAQADKWNFDAAVQAAMGTVTVASAPAAPADAGGAAAATPAGA